jgi:hypothetical protein
MVHEAVSGLDCKQKMHSAVGYCARPFWPFCTTAADLTYAGCRTVQSSHFVVLPC